MGAVRRVVLRLGPLDEGDDDCGIEPAAGQHHAQQCAHLGGRKTRLIDIWMMHAWVVPGFECSWGVFSGECPELGGRLGGTAWEAPESSKS